MEQLVNFQMVNKITYRFVSLVGFVGSILTIWQSVTTNLINQFFSPQWWLVIVFMLLLLALSAFFSGKAAESIRGNRSLVIIGGVYLAITLIWLLFFSYKEITNGLFSDEYKGYFVILLVTSFVSISCFWLSSKGFLFFPSISFLLVGVLFLLLWVYKYIFTSTEFSGLQFVGELLIFCYCSLIYMVTNMVASKARDTHNK